MNKLKIEAINYDRDSGVRLRKIKYDKLVDAVSTVYNENHASMMVGYSPEWEVIITDEEGNEYRLADR